MRKMYIGLFEGLMKGVIPAGGGGYILKLKFNQQSSYSIFEIISFNNLKGIVQQDNNINFQANSHTIYLIYEPENYSGRFFEPFFRIENEKIPISWKELDSILLPNNDRILISQKPLMSYGSFDVECSDNGNLTYYFKNSPAHKKNLLKFISGMFYKDFRVQRKLIEKLSQKIKNNLKEIMSPEPLPALLQTIYFHQPSMISHK